VSGFDCAAATADVTQGALVSCLAFYNPCQIDADCSTQTPYCVIDARYERGSCESGSNGARCRADDDCQAGSHCIAIKEDGTRGCTDGAEGSLCNIDAECRGARCTHPPTIAIAGVSDKPQPAIVGVCSVGESGSPCFTAEGGCPPGKSCVISSNEVPCVGDARCLKRNTTTQANGLCTLGNVGDPCSADDDCKSQHCPVDANFVCTSGVVGDPCSDPSDCETGICAPYAMRLPPIPMHCSSGEVGESCASQADCKSGFCDPDPHIASERLCTNRPGLSGERCQVNDDCQNQVCGQTQDGMVCINGKVGDLCHEPLWCASGFCVFSSCSAGAPGDRCAQDTDCVSQGCMLDPNQGFSICGP
jgi:hypothetical protein